jgi:hypothetical protein
MDRSAATQEIAYAQYLIAKQVDRIEQARSRLRLRPLEWELCDWEIECAREEIRKQREYIERLRAAS